MFQRTFFMHRMFRCRLWKAQSRGSAPKSKPVNRTRNLPVEKEVPNKQVMGQTNYSSLWSPQQDGEEPAPRLASGHHNHEHRYHLEMALAEDCILVNVALFRDFDALTGGESDVVRSLVLVL